MVTCFMVINKSQYVKEQNNHHLNKQIQVDSPRISGT